MKYSEIKKKYKRSNVRAVMFSAIAILIFACAASAQNSFVQQAKLLAADGAAQDSLGFSVAISGDTAVVGAPRHSGGAGLQSRGAAYVYVRDGAGAWTPQQKLVPSDGAANDQFGYAVAISGSTIAVGRQNTTTGQNRGDGKVYIFTRAGTVWTETQTLISSDIAQGDLFGNSLAFENDTLVVGALNKTNGTNFFQGAAYVFTRTSGAGNFTEQAKLTASDGVFADFFGYSVALSGNSVIVGATSLAGQPNSKGKAYVFTRAGSSWTEQAILQAADGTNGDAFGFAVGISGDTAVVGARLDDVGATGDQGSAYVFNRSGSTWTQTQQLFGTETTQRNDTFGGSVAIRGDTIAVGAPTHEFVGSIANHGAVYIFRRSGGVFGRTDKLLHDDPAPDALGTSVAFDGESIISGASSKNSARGAAYVFKTVSTGGQFRAAPADVFGNALYGYWLGLSEDTMAVGGNFGTYIYTRRGAAWEFTQRLSLFTENGGANNIQPGTGIIFSGDTMIVGAQTARIGGVNTRGAVLVYRRSAAGLWIEAQRLLASDGAANDQFGSSLAVSGNTLVVGAENKTVGSNATQGAAYVFTFDSATWTEQQKLTHSDGAPGDAFGEEAAISGDTIVVGAPAKIGANEVSGAAYVFKRNGAVWSEQQKLTASDGVFPARFGTSLAIEGETIVAGAFQQKIGGNNFQGAAYVFTRSGTVWSEQQKLFDASGEAGDNFAIDLAMSGDNLYIGAAAAGKGAWSDLGAVYAYARTGGGGAWQKRGKIYPFDQNRNKQFGYQVALAGNFLAATAVADVNYGVANSGSAYVLDTTRLRFASPDFDFDGDGKADLSVFRPSERNWYFSLSTSGFGAVQFGLAGDKFAPADYDGDGRTDIAVWREGGGGRFYILQSSNGAVREEDFGIAGDNPMPVGDWDGDARADVAVYRASTNTFYFRGSLNNPSGNITYLPWGAAGDLPARGDFDGDGRQDAAVFRPSEGRWYIRQSSNGAVRYENWGLASDKLVPADYDGDGKTDIAVFRSGVWYILQSSNNQPRYESFGLSSDALAPADYDGDGKSDVAVYRNGVWYILQSSNAQIVYRSFGAAGDVSIASAFVQ